MVKYMIDSMLKSRKDKCDEIRIEEIFDENNNSLDVSFKEKFFGVYLDIKYEGHNNYLLIKEMLENADLSNIKRLTVDSTFFNNITELEIFHNLEDIHIDDYFYVLKLETLYRMYEMFPHLKNIFVLKYDPNISYLYDKFDFKIICTDKEFNVIKSGNALINGKNKLDIVKYRFLYINDETKLEDIIELKKYAKKIDTVCFENIDDIKYIDNIIDILDPKAIDNMDIHLSNKDYKDIKLLNKYKNNNISIIYDGYVSCSYKDFINMRMCINYYKSLVPENFSPVEKIMFVYDIIKSLNYEEVEEYESPFMAREIHNILNSGKIVCVGYSMLIKEILTELGIKTTSELINSNIDNDDSKVDPKLCNHERNLVRVDDDKYNLHGIYSLDATWDSANEHEDSLDKYNNFLIPMNKYADVYPRDSYPKLYSYYKGLKPFEEESFSHYINGMIKDTKNYNNLIKSHAVLFSDNADINKYMNADGLNKEQFIEVVTNVKKAFGYKENQLDDEVNKSL